MGALTFAKSSKASEAGALWDRSLPRSVSETGRRSVGNRKERLRDYASSPDEISQKQQGVSSWEGQSLEHRQGDWSLPPPVADEGRRNVGNRKERLRDYASSPEMSRSPEGGEGSELSAPSGRNSEAEHRKLKGVLARLFSFPGCPPIRPLGPAQRVPVEKKVKKKEARSCFALPTRTGNSVVLLTPCFPLTHHF